MSDRSVSSGRVPITPQWPCQLAGYASRTGVFDEVADDLEANALLVEGNDTRVVFVTADLLYVGQEVREGVLSRLKGRLRPEELFISASHTHFGPATDARLPMLGEVDTRYVDWLCSRIAGLVDGLLEEQARPASLSAARGHAHHSLNRRRRARRPSLADPLPLHSKIYMLPNFQGLRDERIDLLHVKDAHSPSQTRAIIWRYACHPVGFPKIQHVSADYPGVVRARIRAQLGPDTPVLFWQGFSGNVRPGHLDNSWGPMALAMRALSGRQFGRFDDKGFRAWSGSLATRVTSLLSVAHASPISGPLAVARMRLPLSTLLEGGPEDRHITLQHVQLGEGAGVLGVSAELMVEHAAAMRQRFPDLIPVSCLDDPFGYIPTDAMVRDGGYEGGGFLNAFSMPGHFRPGLDQIWQDQLSAFVR